MADQGEPVSLNNGCSYTQVWLCQTSTIINITPTALSVNSC
ncbi:hypothetical protein [Phnomibacter ginsenosidimutans]|nr:hypothetical protein [Phnomibacter ginsenosidimutans]